MKGIKDVKGSSRPIVLGISGHDRDAAAAISVDGRLVAAATEDSFARVPGIGYAQTGGFPYGAIDACLRIAGLDAREIRQVVVVSEGHAGVAPSDAFSGAGNAQIDPTLADASLVPASSKAAATVVFGTNPGVLAVFQPASGGGMVRADVSGADALFAAASRLAQTLGVSGADPLAALDRLSVGGDPEFTREFADGIGWDANVRGVRADASAVDRATVRIAGDHSGDLADSKSLNAHVQQMRRSLAASFTASLAGIVSEVARGAAGGRGAVGFAGAAFGNGRLNTELFAQVDRDVTCAPVPEPVGRALAAAGATGLNGASPLAIGPSYSEEEIKRTLDNCRLDYVYEPDWPRLLARASRMLAQGKIVGWFQGPMAFGPRALGSRSILADPANRYARQNLNEYLRGLPLDEPLPVAFAPGFESTCLERPAPAGRVVDVPVRPEWRKPLAAALDWRHAVRVHGGAELHEPKLADLLALHHTATGSPALIEANLAGPGEPIACSPRDAVRTVYSSAIDALVIGRFLLMKDYWLLRAESK